jgi:acetyltransferase
LDRLNKLLNPSSIAVVGASNREGSVGNSLMNNLISHFDGIVYPVNPKRDSILGIKTYKNVSQISGKIDLVIVATPASTVPDIIKECGKKKVQGMVIITAGFKEAGEEGNLLFNKIIEYSEKYKIRLIGPNCLGFLRPKLNLNASFSNKMALPGNVAFLSQSGALCTAVLDWSVEYNVGFSYFVSLGSMADVSFADLIEFFENDKETNAIVIYMESLKDPQKFLKVASSFTRKKPIVVLKVGRSEEGSIAAKSHTGSLTGNDAVFDAAFKKAGIIRVYNSQELFDVCQFLSKQDIPKGNKLTIITNAGGPGVIATDALIASNGHLTKLSNKTLSNLNSNLPPHWSHGNPIDVLGDAESNRYSFAIKEAIKDQNTNGVFVILTPQSMTKPVATAQAIVDVAKKHKSKNIFTSFMGENDVYNGIKILQKNNIPVFKTPEHGINAFLTLEKFNQLKKQNNNAVLKNKTLLKHKKENWIIIQNAVKDNHYSLDEYNAKLFLKNYGIPVCKFDIAKNSIDAALKSGIIGFPIVMKILSPDILHKTDIGGVKINIKNPAEAENAFNEIIKSAKKHFPKAKINGVLIEKMIKYKHELILGTTNDEIFGHTIIFGSGGVNVEVYKDTAIALAPLNKESIDKLIKETKIYKILKGYRGMKGINLKKLNEIILNFSIMLSDFPQIKEIDINPLVADEKNIYAIDAKIIFDKNSFKK